MRGWWICLAASACYQAKPQPGAACSSTQQCPAELACIEGLCLAPGTIVPDASRDPGLDAPLDSPPLPADATPPDPSLVAHWDFEDDPTDGARDTTLRGHDAACVTTCPTLVAGKIGHGYHFDAATSQALRTPDHPDFRGVFTIAAWMRPDTSAAAGALALLSKPLGTGSGNSWQLEIHTNDRLSLSGGNPHTLEGPTVIAPQVWHHVAGTWDGTTKRLYLDGVEIANLAATDDYDTHAVYLGGDENNGTPVLFFNGTLDDLRVYNRVLAPTELAALAMP